VAEALPRPELAPAPEPVEPPKPVNLERARREKPLLARLLGL